MSILYQQGPWSVGGTPCFVGGYTVAQLQALGGAQMPAAVDAYVTIDKADVDLVDTVQVALYQISGGNPNDGKYLIGNGVARGTQIKFPGVVIDPSQGAIALFVEGTGFGLICPYEGKLQIVLPGQPPQDTGGTQTQTYSDKALEAALEAAKEAAKEHAAEVAKLTLIAVAVVVVVIVGLLLIELNPGLPAQVAGSFGRRAPPETQGGP